MIFATVRKSGFNSQTLKYTMEDCRIDTNRGVIEASKAFQMVAEANGITRLPTRKNTQRLRRNLAQMREARLNQA